MKKGFLANPEAEIMGKKSLKFALVACLWVIGGFGLAFLFENYGMDLAMEIAIWACVFLPLPAYFIYWGILQYRGKLNEESEQEVSSEFDKLFDPFLEFFSKAINKAFEKALEILVSLVLAGLALVFAYYILFAIVKLIKHMWYTA